LQENQRLQQENHRLTKELAVERGRNDSLQAALTGLTSGLQGVQTAIGKLESAPRMVVAGPGVAASGGSEVVGRDAPTFVPDKILPDNVEAQIRPDKATAEQSNVSSAASRLRELRRGGG
jgi:cell division septum initiation protein DivIVA